MTGLGRTPTYNIFTCPLGEFGDSPELVEFGVPFPVPWDDGPLEVLVGVVGNGDRLFNGPDGVGGDDVGPEFFARLARRDGGLESVAFARTSCAGFPSGEEVFDSFAGTVL